MKNTASVVLSSPLKVRSDFIPHQNTNTDINVLRKLCCDTILAVEHENSIQFSNVNLMIKNYFEKQFLESKKKLDELETRFENAKKVN